LERFGETLLGVALAYAFGVVIPFLLNQRAQDSR
jgi:predicted outer membrane lipoprotein